MFSEAQSYLIKLFLDKNNISIFSFASSKDLTNFLKKNIEKLLNENVIDSLYKDIKNSLFNESEKLYRSVINEMYYVFYLTNNFKIDDYKNLFCSLFLSDNLKWKKIEDVFDEKWNQSTIINLVNKNELSQMQAKKILYQSMDIKKDPLEIVKDSGLKQITNEDELLKYVREVC